MNFANDTVVRWYGGTAVHTTIPLHLSHTDCISNGQLGQGWVSSWASLPVQPVEACSDSASGWRCACWLLQHVPTRIWNSFSSSSLLINFALQRYEKVSTKANKNCFNLLCRAIVPSTKLKVQKIYELCKKFPDKITPYHAKTRQIAPYRAKTRQRVTSSSYLCCR